MTVKISIAKILKRIVRIVLWIFGCFVILSVGVSTLLLIPPVQKFVVGKVTNFISTKTNMKASVGKVHIGFPKTIDLGGVYIEDLEEDTLFYCEQISINTDLIPLVRKKINIDRLVIDGLKWKVKRSSTDSAFNFSPLLDAFSNPAKPKIEKSESKWEIGFDELTLSNIMLGYKDQIDSTAINLELGHLELLANSVNILENEFELKSIDLGQFSIALMIGDKTKKETPPKEKKESQPIPLSITLGKIKVEDIAFDLQFTSGKLGLSAILKEASLIPDILDLSLQTISLKEIIVNDVDVALNLRSIGSEEDSTVEPAAKEQVTSFPNFTFGDFGWNFFVNHAELSNTNYKMDLDNEPRQLSGMDYMHMDFSDFNVSADSLYFNKDKTGASVSSLSVKEVSGPEVQLVKGIYSMDNREILARNIELQTARSNASGSVSLSYPAMRLIGKEIHQFGIESNLEGYIHLTEIRPFTSVLDNYPLLQNIKNIEIRKFISEGVLGNFNMKSSDIALGDATFLRATGAITGLPSSNINVSFKIDTLITNREDLTKLIPDTLLPSGIKLPHTIALKSIGKTDLSSGNIASEIVSDLGQILLVASFDEHKIGADLILSELDLGQILSNPIYGEINLKSQIEGKIIQNSLVSITSKTDLDSITFNNYIYKNCDILLDWSDDVFEFDAHLSDSSLIAELKGQYREDDLAKHVNLSLNLEKSNLQQLNFIEKYFKASGNLNVDMDFISKDEFKGLLEVNNVDLVKTDNSFHIDTIRFESDINNSYTNFNFQSEILEAKMTGNTKIVELKNAFIDHLDLFIKLPDSLLDQKNFIFEFDMDLKKPDLFTEFLIEDIDEIKLDKCHLKYHDELDILEVEIIVPKLTYNNIIFDSLLMIVDSNSDIAETKLTIKSISNELSFISNLELNSTFTPHQADVSFIIHDVSDSLKYQLNTRFSYIDSLYKMVIDPNRTVINYEKWTIPSDNYLQILEGKFSSQSSHMKNGDQKLWLDSEEKQIRLNFEDFKFQNLSNILEHDSLGSIIDGDITGIIALIDPLHQLTINSEIDIPDLSIFDEYLGNLHAQLEYNKTLASLFNIRLQNDENFIFASGVSSNSSEKKEVNIVLESDITNASSFQPLVRKYIKNLEGGIKGRLAIKGVDEKPSLNGNFSFDNLNFTIIETNTQLKNNGHILIEDNLVSFMSFEIRDSLNHPLEIKGSIDLGNPKNPVYDLTLKTDEFLAVNSKPVADQLIYGKLNLGIDIRILGDQSNLKVTSDFSVNKDTDFTYVMPGKDLELITDKGIVEFIDFENQPYQMAEKAKDQFIGDSIVSLIDGIDFSSILTVDPEAKFTVIVDPNSGDYSQVQFKGKLVYKYNDTQRGTLNGLVELEKGFYELSFYGLVKKRFNYDPGSTIVWDGEVMDGDINLSARHTVRTNSVGLVSNEISSYERAMYNQRLPYDVILMINDQIGDPRVSFELDLPQRYRSSYPTLDSKLTILNQSSMEAERNKQVFALLVGGTFIPENPDVTEGSSNDNFATTAARNSVNAIMTQQLNNLTGQFIKGLDVDLGVNTFDDYSTGNAQTRTQLDVKVSKKLFNERVSAEMESHIDLDGSVENVSNQSTAGLAEFAVSYSLTETGNYRIKVFRENAYDIFDGEIQNSGIAFIFIREFDSFKKIKPENSGIDKDETDANK